MYGSTLANSYYDNEKFQILSKHDTKIQRSYIKEAIEKLIKTEEWMREDQERYASIDHKNRGFITLN